MAASTEPTRRIGRVERAIYQALATVRPAELGSALKTVLGIRRRLVTVPAGFQMYIDPASDFGTRITSDDGYEPKVTRLVQTLMRPGDAFLDLGANEGYFGLLALSAARDSCAWCVEPQQVVAELIRANADVNGFTGRMSVHRTAIADREGTITLYLTPSTNTGSSSVFGQRRRFIPRQEVVPCTSLDQLAEDHDIDHVRLLKIDCEGAEQFIIPGGQRFLSSQCAEFISLEYHPSLIGHDGCRRIDQALRGHRYECTSADGLWVYHRPGASWELAPVGPLAPIPAL